MDIKYHIKVLEWNYANEVLVLEEVDAPDPYGMILIHKNKIDYCDLNKNRTVVTFGDTILFFDMSKDQQDRFYIWFTKQ